MKSCLNCGAELSGAYCSNCGQKAGNIGVSLRTIVEEFVGVVLLIEKRLLWTIRELIKSPGVTVRAYIAGKRVAFMGPIQLLLVCITGYLLCFHFFGGYATAFLNSLDLKSGLEVTPQEMMSYVTANANYFVFLLPLIYAVCYLPIVQRKVTFAELLVFTFYIVAVGLIFSIVIMLVANFHESITLVRFLVYWIFFPWALNRFIQTRELGRLGLAILMSVVAYMIYLIAVALLTLLHFKLMGRI